MPIFRVFSNFLNTESGEIESETISYIESSEEKISALVSELNNEFKPKLKIWKEANTKRISSISIIDREMNDFLKEHPEKRQALNLIPSWGSGRDPISITKEMREERARLEAENILIEARNREEYYKTIKPFTDRKEAIREEFSKVESHYSFTSLNSEYKILFKNYSDYCSSDCVHFEKINVMTM